MSIFRRTTFVVCLSVFVLGLAAGARATTVTAFSNLGPGGTFLTGSNGYGVCGPTLCADQALAMPFNIGVRPVDLTYVTLALGNDPARNNEPITVDLLASTGGLPGSVVLGTLTQQSALPPLTSPALVTFTYSGTLELAANTTYWLSAAQTHPNSDQGWYWSPTDTNAFGVNHSSSPTGPWTMQYGTNSAFAVYGNLVPPTPTAEPGTLSLFLLAAGALGIYEYRRRLVACRS